MKKTVRILSGTLAFLSMVFGICLLLTAIGWPISAARFQELIGELRKMPSVLFLVLFALVCIAVGVLVLYGLIGERMNRKTVAMLDRNALGETYVSFSTLAQIAECAVKSRRDVKTCKAKVYAVGNSVKIDVRVLTAPTASLLEVTRALQDEINASILSLCGTTVGRVDVTVDQTELPQKRT